MVKSYTRLLFGSLVVLAPMFTACERADEISSIGSIETTDFAAKPKKKQAQVVSATSTTSGSVMANVRHGQGATLTIGQFELVIPKGAVKNPSVFRMTVVPGDLIKVQLEAWDSNDYYSGRLDQKLTTFRTPLRLTLPYGAANPDEIGDPTKLVIANISEDGTNTVLDFVNVSVDRIAQTITGQITHFSEWVVARDISIIID